MPAHCMRLIWPLFLTWMAEQMLVAASHPPLLPFRMRRSSSLQAIFVIGVYSTSRFKKKVWLVLCKDHACQAEGRH